MTPRLGSAIARVNPQLALLSTTPLGDGEKGVGRRWHREERESLCREQLLFPDGDGAAGTSVSKARLAGTCKQRPLLDHAVFYFCFHAPVSERMQSRRAHWCGKEE